MCRSRIEPTPLDTDPFGDLDWTQISCGRYHTAALTKKGEVFTWGLNSYGQLGYGDMTTLRKIPMKVKSLNGLIIIQISCGAWHTAALTNKGEMFTWYVFVPTTMAEKPLFDMIAINF